MFISRFDASGMNMQRNIRFKAWKEHQVTYNINISSPKQRRPRKTLHHVKSQAHTRQLIGSLSKHKKTPGTMKINAFKAKEGSSIDKTRYTSNATLRQKSQTRDEG